MRKTFYSVATLIVATLAVAIMAGQIRAQEATPTPIGPTGTTGALLGSAVPTAAPDQTLSLRITTFAPGAIIPLHTDPGTLVVWLESGSITFAVQEGTLVVTRAPIYGAEAVVETFEAGGRNSYRGWGLSCRRGRTVHSDQSGRCRGGRLLCCPDDDRCAGHRVCAVRAEAFDADVQVSVARIRTDFLT